MAALAGRNVARGKQEHMMFTEILVFGSEVVNSILIAGTTAKLIFLY